jgi:hypothetical protein
MSCCELLPVSVSTTDSPIDAIIVWNRPFDEIITPEDSIIFTRERHPYRDVCYKSHYHLSGAHMTKKFNSSAYGILFEGRVLVGSHPLQSMCVCRYSFAYVLYGLYTCTLHYQSRPCNCTGIVLFIVVHFLWWFCELDAILTPNAHTFALCEVYFEYIMWCA